MKGTVIGVNRRLGRIVIQCDDGQLTIAEGENLELHEEVSGPLDEHGGVALRTGSGEHHDVYVQGIYCTQDFAERFLNGLS